MLDPKIYTLLKVVETGNYTKAANALGLSQPAVSQHIHALENELGVKIFERNGTHLTLTREGTRVVQYARSFLALYRRLTNELKNDASGLTSMNIGITHTVEANRISEVLARYATSHPGVSIKLITDTQTKLLARIKNYEVDFAIIDGAFHDPDLVSMPLDTDSLVLIVPPSHPLADKNIVTIEDVKREKLILRLPNSGTRDLFMAALESRDMVLDDFHVILEMDNVATIKDLVRRGYGVSVLAKSACANEVKRKKLCALPIENLSMNREINIVYPRDFEYTGTLRQIISLYQQS